jgi:methyl-accepting chemotaxis protein
MANLVKSLVSLVLSTVRSNRHLSPKSPKSLKTNGVWRSIQNASVVKKLYGSYLILLCFLLAVGGVGLYAGSKLKDANQELYEVRLVSVSEMLGLSTQFERLNSSVSSILLRSTGSATEQLDEIQKTKNDVQKKVDYFNEMQDTYSLSETELQTFTVVWAGYLKELDTALEWYKTGDEKVGQSTGYGMAISIYNSQMTPKIATLTGFIETWVQKNEQLSLSSYQQAQTIQSRIFVLQIFLVIVAAFVSILIGWLMARSIVNPLRQVAHAADEMAQGNLNQTVTIDKEDELGKMAISFNQMASNIRSLIEQVKVTGDQVAISSTELSESADQTKGAIHHITQAIQGVASGSDNQVQSAMESARAMEEMTRGILHIAEKSAEVSETSGATLQEAEQGNVAIHEVVSQMESISGSVNHTASVIKQLGDRSKQIGQFLEVITNISSQTNLLALNAAIEAARAGEHGKGFAVVANEVRKLAEQSKQAADQIAELIVSIQGGTSEAVDAMEKGTSEVAVGLVKVNQAGEAFNRILKAAQHVAVQIEDVSAASQQMSASSQQVTASVEEISRIAKLSSEGTQEIASSSEEQLAQVEEITNSSHRLSRMALQLQELIAKFKI